MRRNGIARILEGAPPGALSQALERALAERRQAPALCAELMALSPRQRRRAVERQHRYATAGLVAHLLCPLHPIADAGSSRERARLALALITKLRPGRYPAGLIWDLTGRAWTLVGGARASQSDEPGAEAAFLRARTALRLGSRDPLEEALLLQQEARLRRRQGRELECRIRLRRARDLYLEVGDLEAAAATESRERCIHRALGPCRGGP